MSATQLVDREPNHDEHPEQAKGPPKSNLRFFPDLRPQIAPHLSAKAAPALAHLLTTSPLFIVESHGDSSFFQQLCSTYFSNPRATPIALHVALL